MKVEQNTTSYLQAMRKVLDTLEEDLSCNLVVRKVEPIFTDDDFFDDFENALDDTDEDDLDATAEWVLADNKGQTEAQPFKMGIADTSRIQMAINNSRASQLGNPAIPQEKLLQLKAFTDACLVDMPFSFDDLITSKKEMILSSFGVQRLTATDRLYLIKDVIYLPLFLAEKQRVSQESVRFGFLWLHDDRKNLQSTLLQILTRRV